MTTLTLKQLRYFEAVAKFGHFGHAADACGISQPALSMQIKDLEEGLGVQLFERATKQVRLTAFGEDFAPRARDILRSVEEVEGLARVAQNRLSGRLRVGVIPTIAPYLLPSFIGHLTLAHPELDLHV
ncbi:MAG: LysR family transcriptional regulator, partial [Octadecabacter sp.]|nr:LysR family transcriptional regulator [Octadecabacter sp.]